MIVSLVYKMVRKLLSVPPVLLRRNTSKDAELLVLRHQNAVLRCQLAGPVRYEPADRLWFAALSGLIPRWRWREVFPDAPATFSPGTAGSSPPSGTTPRSARGNIPPPCRTSTAAEYCAAEPSAA